MNKLLIVYGTGQGQTAKIAQQIAEIARSSGYTVDVFCGDALPRHFTLEGYSAVTLGASIHLGKYQRYMRNFVRTYRNELQRLPSAFFSVSYSARGLTEQDREQARQYVAAFIQATGWQPQLTASFAGALPFSKYGFATKWVMKSITQKNDPQINARQDYEFTDWQAVSQFARDFLASLRPAQAKAPVGSR